MINQENFFDQPVKRNSGTFDNIRKTLQLVKQMIIQLVVY